MNKKLQALVAALLVAIPFSASAQSRVGPLYLRNAPSEFPEVDGFVRLQGNANGSLQAPAVALDHAGDAGLFSSGDGVALRANGSDAATITSGAATFHVALAGGDFVSTGTVQAEAGNFDGALTAETVEGDSFTGISLSISDDATVGGETNLGNSVTVGGTGIYKSALATFDPTNGILLGGKLSDNGAEIGSGGLVLKNATTAYQFKYDTSGAGSGSGTATTWNFGIHPGSGFPAGQAATVDVFGDVKATRFLVTRVATSHPDPAAEMGFFQISGGTLWFVFNDAGTVFTTDIAQIAP